MVKSGRPCPSPPGAETLEGTSGVPMGGKLTTEHLVTFLPMLVSGRKPGPWDPLRPVSDPASSVAPAVQAGRH